MIIITDAHVSTAHENVDDFFAMLTCLEQTDEELVFLGDIFDLWIGLSRYQESIQCDFLDWCRRQRQRRRIGFVEGNHEFFVVERNRDAFTWSSNWGQRFDQLLFVHGDLINRQDRNYLRWRKLSKNWAMRALVRFLPFGPRLVLSVKAKLKKTNKAFRLTLPHDELEHYCAEAAANGVTQVLVGHFHERWSCQSGACQLNVLPDWYASGAISSYNAETGALRTLPWRDLLTQRSPPYTSLEAS